MGNVYLCTSEGESDMHFAFVCFPALLIAGAFLFWAIQRLFGKSDKTFWD